MKADRRRFCVNLHTQQETVLRKIANHYWPRHCLEKTGETCLGSPNTTISMTQRRQKAAYPNGGTPQLI